MQNPEHETIGGDDDPNQRHGMNTLETAHRQAPVQGKGMKRRPAHLSLHDRRRPEEGKDRGTSRQGERDAGQRHEAKGRHRLQKAQHSPYDKVGCDVGKSRRNENLPMIEKTDERRGEHKPEHRREAAQYLRGGEERNVIEGICQRCVHACY